MERTKDGPSRADARLLQSSQHRFQPAPHSHHIAVKDMVPIRREERTGKGQSSKFLVIPICERSPLGQEDGKLAKLAQAEGGLKICHLVVEANPKCPPLIVVTQVLRAAKEAHVATEEHPALACRDDLGGVE